MKVQELGVLVEHHHTVLASSGANSNVGGAEGIQLLIHVIVEGLVNELYLFLSSLRPLMWLLQRPLHVGHL